METQQQDISALCQALEKKAGRRMHTSKDFENLAAGIFEQTHELVSASTLKRLWGYLAEGVTPRRSTLDILSRYLGFEGWDDFCERQTEESSLSGAVAASGNLASSPIEAAPAGSRDTASAIEAAGTVPESQTSDVPVKPAHARSLQWGILAALLCLTALVLSFLWRQRSVTSPFSSTEQPATPVPNQYILKKGQSFESYQDYLRLFGITAKDTWWYQTVPHHDGIMVWGPRYLHPEWHNEGNPDSLMPTITEYWEPSTPCQNKEAKMILERMHTEGYYTARNRNEVRITFMSGLKDSTFIFLGIYRMSLEKSDSTRIVYERIADECDLRALDYLEQLRR